MKNVLQFTIADIQLGVGDHEFKKAFALYERGVVNHIVNDFYGHSAVVSRTHDYNVNVSSVSYDRGNCDCYLGQNDELCKHMLALAIALVYKYRPADIKIINQPLDQAVCSGEIRDVTKDEIKLPRSKLTR